MNIKAQSLIHQLAKNVATNKHEYYSKANVFFGHYEAEEP